MRVISILLLLYISLNATFCDAQITNDRILQAKEKYKTYENSGIIAVAQNLEWYLLRNEKGGNSLTELWSVKGVQPVLIPEAYQYHFHRENWLTAVLKDGRTYFRRLDTGKEKVIDGGFRSFAISDNRLVMVNSKSGDILLFDDQLNLLLETGPTERYDIDEFNNSIVFLKNEKLVDLNLLTLKKNEISIKEKSNWMRNKNGRVWIFNDKLALTIWDKESSQIETLHLKLPSYLDISQINNFQPEIKENRYLLLSVVQKQEKNKELAEIFYTTLSYKYKRKVSQLAIYDLESRQWKWVPKEGDLYSTQKFISDSDFVSYDLVTKNYDTTVNAKVSQQLFLNWGSSQKQLKNPNIDPSHFFYNKDLERILFFENGQWMLEDLKTNMTNPIQIPLNSNFLSDKESGLSDEPWDRIETINNEMVILTDEYDIFSFNLRTLDLKKLTNGREKGKEYRVIKDSNFPSEWGFSNRTHHENGIMLQFFNRSNFYSGISLITSVGKEKWKFVEEGNIKNAKRYKDKVWYTSSFYNKPLSVHLINDGKHKLLLDKGSHKEIKDLKYRIFQYPNSDGALLNAVLLYPKNYKVGNKFPMVMEVYENMSRAIENYRVPHLKDGLGFSYMHYVHEDYFVLLPQVDLKIGELAHSITTSIENALIEVLKVKDIDEEKIGIIGGSFGGYEVTLLMGKTNLFKTAVAGVPVVDLPRSFLTYGKMLNTPEYWRVEKQQLRMGKSLFENWDSYLVNSPVFHMKNVRKPVLIWIGKDDKNVNPDQGRSYFIGLKRLQKEAVLLEYPSQGHNITSPVMAEDLNVKVWQWFDYHLKNKEPAEWIIPMID